MVKLEVVEDEDLNRPQVGPEDEEEWDTDDGKSPGLLLFISMHPIISPSPSLLCSLSHLLESDTSSVTSSLAEESLYDRLAALQDIIPPRQRAVLSNSYNSATSWVGKGLTFGGQALWVISTSVLLVGLPWALAYAEDQVLAEQEAQVKMQQTANEVSKIEFSKCIVLTLYSF
jgi:import receptor subunit TOM22